MDAYGKLISRRTLRSDTTFGNQKPIKNDQRRFLFRLKSSFCSQDIKVLVLNFCLIRKIRLISNFMTSQPG